MQTTATTSMPKKMTNYGKEIADRAVSATSETMDKGSDAVSDASSQFNDAVQEIKSFVKTSTDQIVRSGETYAKIASRQIRARPVLAIAIASGVCLVVSAFMLRSHAKAQR